MKPWLRFALATLLVSSSAPALTREEVLVRARAYSVHRWSSTAANQKASCSAAYESLFPAGDYVGLPYDWGGYMTLRTFDEQIASGYGAGSQETDGILACTAGVDCSGFVSMAWGSGHFTTSTIDQGSSVITTAELLPGDVFNDAGFHVAMFTHLLQSGAPALIEAAGYNVHVNTYGGWSYVNGYVPRRYSGITGTTAGDPVGTTSNPIPITSLPFSDAKDTRDSKSSVLDACGAAPSTPQKGPEYVYVIDVTQPGTLNVAVSDDAAADVDVQLLDNLSTARCIARNDASLSAAVGCGRYWIVVDTYGSNAAKAGPYSLTVSLAPSGQACSAVAGPPVFNPKGKLGDACAYPGNASLPFCNPNLGSETCVYGQSSSFCSKSCATSADCTALGAGACCEDLGKGEYYCLAKSFCGSAGSITVPSDGGSPPSKKDGGKNGAAGDDPDDPASASSSPSDDATPDDEGYGEVKATEIGGCASSTRAPSSSAPLFVLAAIAAVTGVAARTRRRLTAASSRRAPRPSTPSPRHASGPSPSSTHPGEEGPPS